LKNVKKFLCVTGSQQFADGMELLFANIPEMQIDIICRHDSSWKRYIKRFFLLRNYDVLYLFWADFKIYRLLMYKLAGVKVINHFIGSDILKIINSPFRPRLMPLVNSLSKIICVSPLLQQELKNLGVEADLIPFTNLELKKREIDYPETRSAVIYIPNHNIEFYNFEMLMELARRFPDVEFMIFPFDNSEIKLPDNVKSRASIPRQQMFDFISKYRVFIRLPRHDGLPNTLLEALSIGRWCIWNFEFPHTFRVSDIDSLTEMFNLLINKKDPNYEAAEYVIDNFSHSHISEIYKDFFSRYLLG